MAFLGKFPIRSKIVIDDKSIEQVKEHKYVGHNIDIFSHNDINYKILKFNHICGTIHQTIKNKTKKEIQIKLYKTSPIPVGIYWCENWAMKKKRMKNILRAIMGVKRSDKIRNDIIRNELKVDNLYI